MFKHYFERISEQVAIYPLISLSVFFVFFISVGIWAYRAKPEYINKMADLPLNDSLTD